MAERPRPPFDETAASDAPSEGLSFAYRFRESGAAETVAAAGLAQALAEPGGWIWLHLDLANAAARHWVEQTALLPAAGREVLLSHDDHVRLSPVDGGVAGVFADLLRDTVGEERSLGRLRFVLTERLVVSGRREALGSIARTLESIEQGRRFVDAAALLEVIVEHFADAATALAEELAETLDAIEDGLLDEHPGAERRKLGPARRTAVRLHRQLSSLRLLFRRWASPQVRTLPERLQGAAGQLGQRLEGLDQEVVAIQERARLLQEEIAARMAADTNRHLFALSLLTAFLLPPTLIAGVFGMNLPDMPFAHSADGFWIAIAVSLGSGVLVYLLLRLLRVMR